jgi:hypothetical protein
MVAIGAAYPGKTLIKVTTFPEYFWQSESTSNQGELGFSVRKSIFDQCRKKIP